MMAGFGNSSIKIAATRAQPALTRMGSEFAPNSGSAGRYKAPPIGASGRSEHRGRLIVPKS
jgi:hypothetical protein